MANPTVRENIRFLPEDTKPSLSQAWQAKRWLNELDSDLTTPMIRIHKQIFLSMSQPFFQMELCVCQSDGSHVGTKPLLGSGKCAGLLKQVKFRRLTSAGEVHHVFFRQ
ncbi:hypothetical protein B0H10DRAFT_2345690 [Mycena sp. CBHHK59/15]|nr:hypothetical protein B0H10DRAFT_2345690 [Mycena sp. CBHHK59/15]